MIFTAGAISLIWVPFVIFYILFQPPQWVVEAFVIVVMVFAGIVMASLAIRRILLFRRDLNGAGNGEVRFRSRLKL